jgi:GT2 family glycosyltransferase
VLATEWPAPRLDVVLVDNASTDGVVAEVRTRLPVVRVVESPGNRGFGGGCNVAIADLDGVDYVALVNNDAVVDPGWLAPLVAALEADASVGAACPKILFRDRFREVEIGPATGDHGQAVEVVVTGARVGGVDVWSRAQLADGFPCHGSASAADRVPGGATAAGRGLVRLPNGPEPAELRVAAAERGRVPVTSGSAHATVAASPTPGWVAVPFAAAPIDVVNNAGNVLVADGYGADRGYLEPDGPRYREATDVFAWCGGAVVMPSAYLRDVGLFDERLFLYYEDLELAWRGRRRGWRYRYVPEAVVRHVHAASSGDGSERKQYLDERNHLLVLLRHGSARDFTSALGRYLLVSLSYLRRDVVRPVIDGDPPRFDTVRVRARAALGFARLAPSMLRSRIDERHAART